MRTIEVNPCANGALIKAYYDGNNDIIVFERGGLALGHVKAKPVVHGEWIEKVGRAKCSVCADECWADSVMEYKYCPNCGADMRSVSND